MKTFIANETLLLIEGEIYLLDINDRAGLDIKGIPYPVIASTKSLEIVKQLPREVFVKPFDMEGMQDAYIHENNLYECNFMDSVEDIIKTAFEDGYNANKNEFTKEDLFVIISLSRLIYKGGRPKYSVDEMISLIRQLSLPKSITTNDELEIISVSWH